MRNEATSLPALLEEGGWARITFSKDVPINKVEIKCNSGVKFPMILFLA